MFYLYLFSLIVGGGLLVFSVFGAADHADHDLGSHVVADSASAVQWLSLRSLMYFLFVFGGIGAVLSRSWLWAAAPIVFGVALVSGVGVAATVSAVFNYLRRTDSGDRDGDDRFVGLSGRLVLPFGESGLGKVLLSSSERSVELIARPFGGAAGNPTEWRNVIVVEMANGTAMVAPLDDPVANALSSPDHP